MYEDCSLISSRDDRLDDVRLTQIRHQPCRLYTENRTKDFHYACNATFFICHSYRNQMGNHYYYRTHFSGSADVQYAIKRYKKNISTLLPHVQLFRTLFFSCLFIYFQLKKRQFHIYNIINVFHQYYCASVYISILEIFFSGTSILLLYVFRGYAQVLEFVFNSSMFFFDRRLVLCGMSPAAHGP